MNPDLKSLAMELKAIDGTDPHGEFEAILSAPVVDRDGELVEPGAFAPLPKSIPVHFSHDFIAGAAPIGVAEPYYDGDLLKVKGRFAPTDRAQEMRALVKGGFITAMSAGFIPTVRKDKSIIRADLVEGSLTATPVNASALILASKSLDVEHPTVMEAIIAAAAEQVTDEVEVKAGARNSAADSERIQTMHDTAVELGASCPAMKTVNDLTAKAESAAGSAAGSAADEAAESAADPAADQLERDRQRVRAWQIAVPQ